MDKNITLDEYKNILGNVKAAALKDMKMVEENGPENSRKSALSLLVLELKCRDLEDYELERQERVQIFTDFASLLEGMRDWRDVAASFWGQMFSEPVSDKLYWRVSRYTGIFGRMAVLYSVYFTLDEEIFSVEPDYEFACFFEQHGEVVRQNISVSPSLEYILQNRRQLMLAWNVELSLQPGDTVYVDVRPFKAPFYAVYHAEADSCGACEEDPYLKNIGYTIRTHPFFPIPEERNASEKLHLWRCQSYPFYTKNFYLSSMNGCSGETLEEDVVFPHTPYERMKVVEYDGKKVEQTDKR